MELCKKKCIAPFKMHPGCEEYFFYLRERCRLSDIFIFTPDPSPQLTGHLLHLLVSTRLPLLHSYNKSHCSQGAWEKKLNLTSDHKKITERFYFPESY